VSNADGPRSDLDLSLDGYFEFGAEVIDIVRPASCPLCSAATAACLGGCRRVLVAG
jgi:hypothetical protein